MPADRPHLIIRPESRPQPLGPGAPRTGPASRKRGLWRRFRDGLTDGPLWRRALVALGGLFVLGVTLALAGVVGLVAYALSLKSSMPDTFEVRAATSAQPTLVYAASGEKLTQFEPRFREWVPLDSVPVHFTRALVATEDRRFYEHGGVDVRRTIGALYYTARGDRQGGSTITQQLTRNLFPAEIGGARLLDRKLKEVLASREIEGAHTKREILEAYVNTAPFLYNAFGVERAARTYFGRPARELTVAQSATLVGMLKGTNRYNPVRNPERAMARRNLVLRLMGETGSLSPAEVRAAQEEPLGVTLRPQPGESSLAPHFTEMVRRQLRAWADEKGFDVERDGLVVRTTLDLGLQREAEAAVARRVPGVAASGGVRYTRETLDVHLRRTDAFLAAVASGEAEDDALRAVRADEALVDSVRGRLTRLQTGLVALDPKTGHVKAYVGSRDFDQDPFDHAGVAQRQPGSVFKAFVYAAALQRGYAPEDRVLDAAPEVDLGDGTTWRPRNAGGGASGAEVTLEDALAYSKNTVAAQLGQEIGAPRLALMARVMGIESDMDVVPSLALGTSPVTVLETVSAYGTIANDGMRRAPVFIRRIETASGRVLEERAGRDQQAITHRTARVLTGMLQEVVRRGTGARAREYGVTGDLGGKTGTTQDNMDGWFVLMHPRLVAGAWVGYSDQRVTFARGQRGYGSRTALPVVATFMAAAEDRLPPAVFPDPPGWGESLAAEADSLFGRGENPEVAEFDWDAYLEGYGEDPAAPRERAAPDVERPDSDRPDLRAAPSPEARALSRNRALRDLRDDSERDDLGDDDLIRDAPPPRTAPPPAPTPPAAPREASREIPRTPTPRRDVDPRTGRIGPPPPPASGGGSGDG